VAEEVARRLGDHVFTTEDEDLEEVVGRLLEASGLTVAAAESLTGGSLGARLSNAPGSSAIFRGSAVCYTAEAKHDVLGVSRETIDGPGVVSEECAREMARGARRLYRADLAVSLTGVAGPDPHDGKPVGTVCVALAGPDVEHSLTFRAPGDRDIVRRWSEQVALDLLRRHLSGLPTRSDLVPSTGFARPSSSTP
jgi:nicotinamide-nucleotide amidase